ncbi:hypothetical protein PoB_001700100 [Plakobranchus ocellatus]|uniref:Uncharacterized protein n=1 Tax=Plakobranchus ocellatus TaxID=259542 RepID=A0AAV3Z3P0_9GAST|nr:hypothetical protein PoB_001700100 [Plakobranchus ocellatus]
MKTFIDRKQEKKMTFSIMLLIALKWMEQNALCHSIKKEKIYETSEQGIVETAINEAANLSHHLAALRKVKTIVMLSSITKVDPIAVMETEEIKSSRL